MISKALRSIENYSLRIMETRVQALLVIV